MKGILFRSGRIPKLATKVSPPICAEGIKIPKLFWATDPHHTTYHFPSLILAFASKQIGDMESLTSCSSASFKQNEGMKDYSRPSYRNMEYYKEKLEGSRLIFGHPSPFTPRKRIIAK